MKLKSLLAIVSCSAIALSISVPSIAETVKDSKVESASIGIGNKDYRNKQSTPSIVGSWVSSVNNNEYRHLNPMEIYWDIKSGGTTTFAFRPKSGDNFSETTYKYTPAKNASGIWVEKGNEQGETFVAVIKWISYNEFVLTLIKDSLRPERNGLQRRFVRIQEPVATTLQQQAQQAAANEESNRKLNDARIRYRGVSGSWPQFWDASGSIDTTPLSP